MNPSNRSGGVLLGHLNDIHLTVHAENSLVFVAMVLLNLLLFFLLASRSCDLMHLCELWQADTMCYLARYGADGSIMNCPHDLRLLEHLGCYYVGLTW